MPNETHHYKLANCYKSGPRPPPPTGGQVLKAWTLAWMPVEADGARLLVQAAYVGSAGTLMGAGSKAGNGALKPSFTQAPALNPARKLV